MEDNKEPKKLASGKPERYDIDDAFSLGTPPKYTMLKVFDAKTIFTRYPHKYDSLIAQEEDYAKDDLELECAKLRSDDFTPRRRLRSNSFSSLDDITAQTSLLKTEPRSGSTPGELNRADNLYRRCSLDHMTDYYSRRSSDVAISAIWDAPGHPRWRSPDKVTMDSAVASYKPNKIQMETFGERHLTKIMMEAAFKEPQGSSKKKGLVILSGDRRGSTSSQEDSPKKEIHDPHMRRMSFPETAKEKSGHAPLSEEVSTKVTTVQPHPRRLFGIGPLYHPLPETVVESPVASGGSLVDAVKKEGIRAVKEDAVKGPIKHKKAPTKAEVNTWAPFSM